MDDEKINTQSNSADAQNDQHSAISADLIRGHINTIILRALYERDKYGYEIIDEIENKSHGQYTMKQPTLYSALKRLESQGYITAYWKTDEVSQGGRRKYFTLTDSGREMAEKNQAEWEYSRTVIDSLISERNFDFTQPAPAAVDFKILKNSTSRVPIVKNKDDDYDESEEDDEEEPINNTDEEPIPENDGQQEYSALISEEPPLSASVENISEQITSIHEEPAAQYDRQPISEYVAPANHNEPEEIPDPAPQPMSEEQRRRVHENYLKLISEPVRKDEVPEMPYADDIDTNKLIYNNRPEPERDYKNLVNTLFVNTIRATPVAEEEMPPAYQSNDYAAQYSYPSPPQPAPAPTQAPVAANTEMDYAGLKANDDGLTVNTSDFTVSNSRKKRFNLSKILFKCSLIIFAIIIVEFVFTLIFKNNLGVTIAYPLTILSIGCVQLIIFGVLRYIDFGKSARKPTSLTYITVCSVFAILAILIIIVVSLLLNIDFSSAGDIMAKIVIPCIIALNIPIFATLFYIFSKA